MCPLTDATTAQIQALPLEQLETLADALLDFTGTRNHRAGGAGAPQRCTQRPAGAVRLRRTRYARPDQGSGSIPHGQASAAFGGDWMRTGQQLGLVLPSVVVPQARNLLLNPLHPAMAQVALVHQEPFQLDQRLG